MLMVIYVHATTQDICDQWVLEYADPSTLAAIKRNTTPRSTLPVQDASNLETWRRRFGYISEKATRQLLDVATGIEITDLKAPPYPKGEPIPLTQAHELAGPEAPG
jgi:hypothetical protein